MSGHKEQNTVLLTLEYPPQLGGIATYLAYFAERFPAVNMTVLAPPHDGAAEFDAQSSVPIERRPLSAGWLRPRWLPALYWAWRTCRRVQADVLVVSHLSNMGRVALWLRRLLGLPYVVVLHGMDIALAVSGRPGKRAAAKNILAQADQIVCNSEYTSRWVSSIGLATDNIAVVNPPPSVPLESTVDAALVSQFRDRLNLGDSFVLLSAGRLVERKGFDRCLQAVAVLREEQRDIQYVIVGEGPDRARLEQLSAELGVSSQVHFLGAVSADDATHANRQLGTIAVAETGNAGGQLLELLASAPIVARPRASRSTICDRLPRVCGPMGP